MVCQPPPAPPELLQDAEDHLDKTFGECEALRKQLEKGHSGVADLDELESMARTEFKKMRGNIKQISRSEPLHARAPSLDPDGTPHAAPQQ